MRLIDVDKLEPSEVYMDYGFTRIVYMDDIDEMPTVDPLKHGHWVFYEEPDGYYHSECSECGQWCDEDVFLKGKWHYCPNCGAKMENING